MFQGVNVSFFYASLPFFLISLKREVRKMRAEENFLETTKISKELKENLMEEEKMNGREPVKGS